MKEIEYFYSAHSAFAYLGSARFQEIAKAAGRRIIHRPVDLARVMAALGATDFADRSKAHRAYFFGREIERWAAYRGAPVMGRPTHHDNPTGLANCMLIACARLGADTDALSHALLRGHWQDDADLADAATLEHLARAAGIEPRPLLAAARSAEIRALYDANTDEAIARSVFGSPTYFVDNDMFYGQDRLEMLEHALTTPFAGV